MPIETESKVRLFPGTIQPGYPEYRYREGRLTRAAPTGVRERSRIKAVKVTFLELTANARFELNTGTDVNRESH